MYSNIENKSILLDDRKKLILEILLSLCSVFSVLSQIPLNTIDLFSKPFLFFLWTFTLCFVLFAFAGRLRFRVLCYILPVLIFDCLIMLFQIFSGKSYLSSQLFYPIHLSSFIFIVCYFCGQFLTEKSFKRIINLYVISVIIVSLYIFFTYYFGLTNWFSSTLYIYSSKNSFAQIVLFAAVLIFLYGFMNNKKLKFPLIFLLIFFLLLLKCRSTLVGLFIIVIYIVFFHIKNFSLKVFVVLFFLIFLLSIFIIPSFNDFFIEGMIFNNRGDEGWGVITSGRLSHFNRFLSLFRENPIIGNGKVRIESFPLSILAGFGVFAGSFLIFFAITPLIFSIKRILKKEISPMLSVLFLFSMISLSNCLFEEQAPFGPGVKCFMLWFVYGFFLGMEDNHEDNHLP